MRLLNTTSFKVEEFVESGTSRLEYAILSHTWGKEEVTFQDMRREFSLLQNMEGITKLQGSCAQAKKDGYKYIWIDTCCIDKSSSAELSEAINSMYRWYKEARVCYAYLSDVPSKTSANHWQQGSSFRESRWFTRKFKSPSYGAQPYLLERRGRTCVSLPDGSGMLTSRKSAGGWTLQELIAPSNLIFFSDTWNQLGSKAELSELIAEITGIDSQILQTGFLENASVARKMSWASNRVTTRVEDRAYSLLGLFDVNMPLLYGEGKKSFMRLQEEILKQIDDDSIFAHQGSALDICDSLLAEVPDYFSESADIFLYQRNVQLHDDAEHVSMPCSLTSKGVQLYSFGCPCTITQWSSVGWLMLLNCRLQNDVFARLAVLLSATNLGADRFERDWSEDLLLVHRYNGKTRISRWGDGRRVWEDGFETSKESAIYPEFGKLQYRTIFVSIERSSKSRSVRPCIWVKDIIQPRDAQFILMEGWPIWSRRSRMLSANVIESISVGPVRGSDLSGALLFQKYQSEERFVIIVDMNGLYPKFRGQLRAQIIELVPGTLTSLLELKHIMDFLYDKEGLLHFGELLNKKHVINLALLHRLVVRATVAVEEFLGRKECILTIEILNATDERIWEEMRGRRVELFQSKHAGSGVASIHVGYMVESDGLEGKLEVDYMGDSVEQEPVNVWGIDHPRSGRDNTSLFR